MFVTSVCVAPTLGSGRDRTPFAAHKQPLVAVQFSLVSLGREVAGSACALNCEVACNLGCSSGHCARLLVTRGKFVLLLLISLGV